MDRNFKISSVSLSNTPMKQLSNNYWGYHVWWFLCQASKGSDAQNPERNFFRRGWEATAKELGLQERTQQGCEIIELLFSNCPSRTFWPSKIAMKFENFFANKMNLLLMSFEGPQTLSMQCRWRGGPQVIWEAEEMLNHLDPFGKMVELQERRRKLGGRYLCVSNPIPPILSTRKNCV